VPRRQGTRDPSAKHHPIGGSGPSTIDLRVLLTFTSTSRLCYHPGEMSLPAEPRLLRINEVAAETGLTTRAIRYYEQIGLLEPAARSEGDYRLYDASDLDRLQFIRGLRDDAGFSLAQIGQLLEDEAARARNRERLRVATDPAERRVYLAEAEERIARQVALLEAKASRLASMIDEAQARLRRVRAGIAELTELDPPMPVGPIARGPKA
jgi:MerR family transcriptional regulator, repressor of the yfmOP operon